MILKTLVPLSGNQKSKVLLYLDLTFNEFLAYLRHVLLVKNEIIIPTYFLIFV